MIINPIIVEYLIIIKQEDTFCNSDNAFIKFLDVDGSISISEKNNELSIKLTKKNNFKVSYKLKSGLVPSQEERYFKLTLSSQEKKLSEFGELLSILDKIIKRLHPEVSINVLWNDISRYYAIEGYGLINEVENLLRRLIANFMLINVGYEWHKYHIPSSVENRDSHLKENYSDYLHQTYFSDLKTILFEGQRDFNLRDIGAIQLFVERCISDKKEEIQVDDLKGVIAKSLWEKFFSKDTNYKKKDLEDDIEKLNKLRNEIAHNRHITRETLGKIQSLSKKIINTLKLELEDLPNKVLSPEEQKFQVTKEKIRIVEENPQLTGVLIERAVYQWYKYNYGSNNIQLSPDDLGIDIVINLNKENSIGVQVKGRTKIGFRQIRNKIVHGNNLNSFFPPSIQMFEEFHLTIVIIDYVIGDNIPYANELNTLLTRLNPSLRLILGYLDEHNQFVEIKRFL